MSPTDPEQDGGEASAAESTQSAQTDIPRQPAQGADADVLQPPALLDAGLQGLEDLRELSLDDNEFAVLSSMGC